MTSLVASQDSESPYGENSLWLSFKGPVSEEDPQGLIDLHNSFEIVKEITSISIEPGVEVEVTIVDSSVDLFNILSVV